MEVQQQAMTTLCTLTRLEAALKTASEAGGMLRARCALKTLNMTV